MIRLIFTLFLLLISHSSAIFSYENNLPDGYEFADLEEEEEEEEDTCNEDDALDYVYCKSMSKDLPDSNNAMATLEAGPNALIAGHVNAITGDFVDFHTSLTVPGTQPLSVQCFYCSSEKKWNFRHMPSLEVGSSNGGNHLHASYLDDSGSGITYRASFDKSHIKGRHLTIPSSLYKKGLTNCGSGIINGKTNWKNSFVSKIRKHDAQTYMLTHGSGISRIFAKEKSSRKEKEEKVREEVVGTFHLESENHPNGNRLFYSYRDNKLSTIKAVNKVNQLLAKLSLIPDGKKVVHWVSNDGQASFVFCDKKQELIQQIISTHAVPVTYRYNKHRELEKKVLPEGRFLRVKFHRTGNEKGRVAQLITPVGITHTFNYNLDGLTTVRNAEGNSTIYRYDKKSKQLQNIRRYDHTLKCVSCDNFYWSDAGHSTGNLIARTFECREKAYFSHVLAYDDFGNVTQDHLYGNLTGTSLPPLNLNGGYFPTSHSDVYINYYHYSQDGRNLLLVENDGKKIIHCDYYPNQLLKARLTTQLDGKILKREFFHYDEGGVLTHTICDDGQAIDQEDLSYITERHAQIIIPRVAHPVGLPQIIDEYYMDMASLQYQFLKRTIYHHSPQGKVLQEDHYGSDENLAYRLKWEYDNLGHIIKEIDALGQTKTFCYDGNENKIREDGPVPGWCKTFEYDLGNRLFKETEHWPDGTILVTSHEYNKLNQRISTTDPQGNTTIFTYDALGRIVKTQHPSLFVELNTAIIPSEETQYDAMGNAIVQKNANGHITKSAYTIRGQPYRIEYPDGSIEQKEYSTSGLLIKEIARNGLITEYAYDPFDRILSTVIKDPQGNPLKTTSSVYSTFNLLAETDEDGLTTSYEYDGAGRCITMRKGDRLTHYQYDVLGRLEKTIESMGCLGAYHRQVDDRESGDESPHSQSNPINDDARVTCNVYDLLNRVIEERIEDRSGHLFKKEQYTYDVNGNRTSVTVFTEAGKATTTTEYTPDGKPLIVTDALGNQTRYTYDHHFSYKGQNVLAVTKTDPLGCRETIVHDTHGNACWQGKTDAFGHLIQEEISCYDPLGQKTYSKIVVYEGSEKKRTIETSWEYDSMRNMFHCTEALGTPEQKEITHHYNSYGQKVKTDMPNGVSIIYEYDHLGLLSSYKSTDNTIYYQYTYDKKDRPILVKDLIHDTATERSYDLYGNLTSETLDNRLTLTYTNDDIDRPLSVTLPDQSTICYRANAHHLVAIERIKEGKIAYIHHYPHYDLAGNVIEETLLDQGGTIHYKYDLLQRPISVEAPHWQESIPQDGFDALGNLLKREVKDGQGFLSYTYAYDSLHQLIAEDGFISCTYQHDSVYNRTAKDNQPNEVNALNQLKSQSNYSYHYDANGNLIEKATDNNKINYMYDALDRLIEVHNGPEITTYTYDSFHRRINKTQNGTIIHYIYQDQNELGAVINGKITQLRVLGLSQGAEIGGAVALELDNKVYAPIHDPQGNIVALVDDAGQLIENYRYTAFGETKVFSKASVENPWRFSSKRFDPETGFIYFGRRYYDPAIGRWVTPDPAGFADGPNLYAYVRNRPLIYIDPDGRFAYAACQAVAAAATSFTQGLAFGNSMGNLSQSTGNHEAIKAAAQENSNPFCFTTGAMLSAHLRPLNNAIEATLDFLHKDVPGLTSASIPYGPGRASTALGRFSQLTKESSTFLVQRTQAAAFNSMKMSEPAELASLSTNRMRSAIEKGNPGALSSKSGADLATHLRYSQDYSKQGVKFLQNERIRYYGEIKPPKIQGEMIGRRYVHEFNPSRGSSRGWMETLDSNFRVRQVRPQMDSPYKTHYFFDINGNLEKIW